MSIDYSTYVGPYVRCAVGTKKERASRQTCPNVACPNMGAHLKGFCPLCGSAIAEVPYTYLVSAVDTYDLQEAIHERLTDANGDAYHEWVRENAAHLWKPNVAWASLRDPHLDSRTDFNLQDITADLVRAELAQFEVFFADDLATFRTAYGEASVTVRWGVIQDYS